MVTFYYTFIKADSKNVWNKQILKNCNVDKFSSIFMSFDDNNNIQKYKKYSEEK